MSYSIILIAAHNPSDEGSNLLAYPCEPSYNQGGKTELRTYAE